MGTRQKMAPRGSYLDLDKPSSDGGSDVYPEGLKRKCPGANRLAKQAISGYLCPLDDERSVAGNPFTPRDGRGSPTRRDQKKTQTTWPILRGREVERESYQARRCFFPDRCRNGRSLFVLFIQGGGQASACETIRTQS